MVVRNSTVLELLCPFLVNWSLTPSIQKGCQAVPKHSGCQAFSSRAGVEWVMEGSSLVPIDGHRSSENPK